MAASAAAPRIAADEIQELCSGAPSTLANELLREFHSGYPVHNLRRLLYSHEDNAVKAGAWLTSELGEQAASLLGDLEALVVHPLRYVRFYVLDAILVLATNKDGRVIARAIDRLQDTDDVVRWKAITFLSKATPDQLRASIGHFSRRELPSLVAWFVMSTEVEPAEVLAKLDDNDPLSRRFAVAIAAKRVDSNPALLRYAANSGDPDIRSFARGELDRVGLSLDWSDS